jgi:hypothetical protein
MFLPPVTTAQHDGNGRRIANDDVVWSCTNNIAPVLFKEFA